MFQTATVTDLRFKTNELIKKSKNLVWIFHRGKKVALLIDAEIGDALLEKAAMNESFQKPASIHKKGDFLKEISLYQFKGPKNLSKNIDTSLYE